MSIAAVRSNPWRVVAALAVVFILAFPLLNDDLYYQNMIMLSLVFAIGARRRCGRPWCAPSSAG